MRRRGVRQPAPLAADGGVVLNFESRGSTGPAVMFETSRRQRRRGRVYGAPCPTRSPPASRSRSTGSCPTTPTSPRSVQSGRFTGLNTAYIDGSAVYHSPRGHTVLLWTRPACSSTATTRSPWPARSAAPTSPRCPGRPASDATYFPVLRPAGALPGRGWSGRWPGSPCSPWPPWRSWPAGAGLVTWPRVAAGFGLAFVPLLLAPVLAQLLWTLLVAIRPGYGDMIDPWRPGWFRPGRGRARRDRPAGLVRAAAPALRRLGADRWAPWSCWRSSGWCWPPPRPAGPTWPRCRRWPGPSPGWSR